MGVTGMLKAMTPGTSKATTVTTLMLITVTGTLKAITVNTLLLITVTGTLKATTVTTKPLTVMTTVLTSDTVMLHSSTIMSTVRTTLMIQISMMATPLWVRLSTSTTSSSTRWSTEQSTVSSITIFHSLRGQSRITRRIPSTTFPTSRLSPITRVTAKLTMMPVTKATGQERLIMATGTSKVNTATTQLPITVITLRLITVNPVMPLTGTMRFPLSTSPQSTMRLSSTTRNP